jgi:hypothetical protein
LVLVVLARVERQLMVATVQILFLVLLLLPAAVVVGMVYQPVIKQ